MPNAKDGLSDDERVVEDNEFATLSKIGKNVFRLRSKIKQGADVRKYGKARLKQDYKEVVNHPLDTINARPLESDMYEWHCNIAGPAGGPYEGIVFHVIFYIPENYPAKPPKVRLCTRLDHPNIFRKWNRELKEREEMYWICVDILASEWIPDSYMQLADTVGFGWSPAYSIQSILVQLQAFFFDNADTSWWARWRIASGGWADTIMTARRKARSFKCMKCEHTGHKPWPDLPCLADPLTMMISNQEMRDILHTRNIVVRHACNLLKQASLKKFSGKMAFIRYLKTLREWAYTVQPRKSVFLHRYDEMYDLWDAFAKNIKARDWGRWELRKPTVWPIPEGKEHVAPKWMRLPDVISDHLETLYIDNFKDRVKHYTLVTYQKREYFVAPVPEKDNENCKKPMDQVSVPLIPIDPMKTYRVEAKEIRHRCSESSKEQFRGRVCYDPVNRDRKVMCLDRVREERVIPLDGHGNTVKKNVRLVVVHPLPLPRDVSESGRTEWLKDMIKVDVKNVNALCFDAGKVWKAYLRLNDLHYVFDVLNKSSYSIEDEKTCSLRRIPCKRQLADPRKRVQQLLREFGEKLLPKEEEREPIVPVPKVDARVIYDEDFFKELKEERWEGKEPAKGGVQKNSGGFTIFRSRRNKVKVKQRHVRVFKLGQKVTGVVSSIAEYGSFIDVGWHRDGLLHVSCTRKSYQVGESVEVYVEKIEMPDATTRRGGKLSLSTFLSEKFISRGDKFRGTVTKVFKNGAFVDIGCKFDAYLPRMRFEAVMGKTLIFDVSKLLVPGLVIDVTTEYFEYRRPRNNPEGQPRPIFTLDLWLPPKPKDVLRFQDDVDEQDAIEWSWFGIFSQDLCGEIYKYLNRADLNNCYNTCRYLRRMVEDKCSIRFAKEDLRCFHSKRGWRTQILGLGVNLERYENNGVLSQIHPKFDLLAFHSFNAFQQRKTAWNETFTHFLPVYICPRHGERSLTWAKYQFKGMIHKDPYAGKWSPELVLKIIPTVLTSMIVDTMKGEMHESIVALEGYTMFYHLLLAFIEKFPELQVLIDSKVENFRRGEEFRNKKIIPNLGHWIACLAASNKYSWRDLCTSYLRENFDRNAKWILKKHFELHDPKIPMANRLKRSLSASLVSLKLCMFHVTFLRMFRFDARSGQLRTVLETKKYLDSLYGRPSHSMVQNLQKYVKRIKKTRTYEEFFSGVGVKCPSDEELGTWLMDSIYNSERRGYHKLRYLRPKKVKKVDPWEGVECDELHDDAGRYDDAEYRAAAKRGRSNY